MRFKGELGVEKENLAQNNGLQFCVLEYKPHNQAAVSMRLAPILLLVLRNEKGSLQFLVHPDWRSTVQSEDLKYFDCLFCDFLERAETYPDDLFEQISSLGVGPIVTQEVGMGLHEHPFIQKFTSELVDLESTLPIKGTP
jgi:hypothetical protein